MWDSRPRLSAGRSPVLLAGSGITAEQTQMLILGLSSFKNDTAAALLRDGVISAAIENAKLQPSVARGLPEAAIEFCLKQGSASWKDLDLVAVASDATPGWRRRSFSR